MKTKKKDLYGRHLIDLLSVSGRLIGPLYQTHLLRKILISLKLAEKKYGFSSFFCQIIGTSFDDFSKRILKRDFIEKTIKYYGIHLDSKK